MNHIQLTYAPLDVAAVTDLVRDGSCGAISMFIGTTRDDFEGRKVVSLEYEAYEPMALKEMTAICEEIRQRWPEIKHIGVHHRLGVVPEKEASVVIALSSPHRKAALVALEFAIDELKRRVPIWKKELYESATAEWKENGECQWRKDALEQRPALLHSKRPKLDFRLCRVEQRGDDTVPASLVQIGAVEMEIERRINCFVEKKREEINVNNILDFTEQTCQQQENDSEISEQDAAGSATTCARTNVALVKQEHSKCHLKVRRITNQTGPQLKPNYLQALDKLKIEPKPYGIRESRFLSSSTERILSDRLMAMEHHLRMPPTTVPRIAERADLLRRIKLLENRILHLESISPEYKYLMMSGALAEGNHKTADWRRTRDDIDLVKVNKHTTYTVDELDKVIRNLTDDNNLDEQQFAVT